MKPPYFSASVFCHCKWFTKIVLACHDASRRNKEGGMGRYFSLSILPSDIVKCGRVSVDILLAV